MTTELERRELAQKLLKESLLAISALGFGVEMRFSDGTQAVMWPGITQAEPLLTRVSEPDYNEYTIHRLLLLTNLAPSNPSSLEAGAP